MDYSTNTPLDKQSLPYSTAVLVLGILSIISCFCYGLLGIILGVTALILASKSNKVYRSNPSNYSDVSYKNMKAGKVCAIVGLSLSAVYFIVFIGFITLISSAFINTPWMELVEQMDSFGTF